MLAQKIWGEWELSADVFLACMCELLDRAEPGRGAELVFGQPDPDYAEATIVRAAYGGLGRGMAAGADPVLLTEWLTGMRDQLPEGSVYARGLDLQMASVPLNAGQFEGALEAVEAVEGALDPSVLEASPAHPPETGLEAWAEDLGHLAQLRGLRATALSGLGAADEGLSELRQAHLDLETLRALPGLEDFAQNQALHGGVGLSYGDALLTLRRNSQAKRVYEQLDEVLSGARAADRLRLDLAGRQLLGLAGARIGLGASATSGGPARKREFEAALQELEELLDLKSESSQFPVAAQTLLRARLWRGWVELELGLPTARERVLDLGAPDPDLGDPGDFLFHTALSAKDLRLHGSLEQRAQRERLLESALQRLEDQWGNETARSTGVGVLANVNAWMVIGEWAELLSELHSGAELGQRLAATLERVAVLGSLPRDLGASAGSWEGAYASAIAPGRGLLMAVPCGWGPSRVLLIEKDAVHLDWTLAVSDLELQAQDLASLIGRAPSGGRGTQEARRAAGELRDTLLSAELQGRIAKLDRLVVVGFDLFGGVPFAALPEGEDGWFGTRLGLVEVPSLSAAGALMERRVADNGRPPELLGLRRLEAGDGREPIVLGEPLIAALEAPFERAELLSESEATVAGLEAGLSRPEEAALLLLAHGSRAPDRVRAAGLLLASTVQASELLLADRVERMDLSRVRLAVLASCGAGQQSVRLGDSGAASLYGALLRAGAGGSLHARGELPAHATVELLAEVFAAWAPDVPLDVALARGRAKVAAQPGREHPFFHAQLQLFSAP